MRVQFKCRDLSLEETAALRDDDPEEPLLTAFARNTFDHAECSRARIPCSLGTALLLLAVGCGGGRETPATASGVVDVAAKSDSEAPMPQAASHNGPSLRHFSGEIVFRQTFVASSDGHERRMDDVHYFISGAHWKHVNANGNTTALYDPETRLVHYFNGKSSVDTRIQSDVSRFEHLDATKVILGRSCRGIRRISGQTSSTTFYDPTLTVDPSLYSEHHFGGWAEYLVATGGALFLWQAYERPDGVLVWEAIRIAERSFDSEFWNYSHQNRVADAQP